MLRKFFYSLPGVFILASCSPTPDKYLDVKKLELPPTLEIEHTNTVSTENSAGLPETVGKSTEKSKMPIDGSSEEKPKEEKEKPKEEKPAYAELSKLILLVGDPKKPTLQLKTRFDRAWILVADGLSAAGIQVVDTKQDAGVFRVSYVDNDKGKGRGLINSLTSFFSDELEDTEYTLTVDRDKKITDVHVDKVLKADSGKEASNNDDSAALMQLLHKSIIDNLSK